jgi:ribosome-associated translation inhibitor RaiA
MEIALQIGMVTLRIADDEESVFTSVEDAITKSVDLLDQLLDRSEEQATKERDARKTEQPQF